MTECVDPPRFIPFSDEQPKTIWDNPGATGRWTKCPNLKSTYDGYDRETYACEVCGKIETLYYEDMQ